MMQAKLKDHVVPSRQSAAVALLLALPAAAFGQAASPFMTGATALQTNILAWLTPIAIILVMALGGMAMANRIVENCGNTLILRCAGSEHGGTSRFASGLIGEREVLRTAISRSRRPTEILPSVTRAEHLSVESAVMSSEIEQLPDLAGYLKIASRREWLRVGLTPQPRLPHAYPVGASPAPRQTPAAVPGSARNMILPFVRAGAGTAGAGVAGKSVTDLAGQAHDGFDAGC